MNVQEFCKKWGVKRTELSVLLNVPQGTMAHWFAAGVNDRSTPASVQKTLEQVDFLFSLLLGLDERFPETKAVFDTVLERRSGTVFQQGRETKKHPD